MQPSLLDKLPTPPPRHFWKLKAEPNPYQPGGGSYRLVLGCRERFFPLIWYTIDDRRVAYFSDLLDEDVVVFAAEQILALQEQTKKNYSISRSLLGTYEKRS